MATTLEILDGISQVLANSYDGAQDDSGESIKIGLRREEGNPLIVRTSVRVHKCYKIGSMPIEPEREIDPEFERMNALGGLRKK